MTINLGVKALLSWVNSMKLNGNDVIVEDLQDGTILLKIVYMLKKEHTSCFPNSIQDRLKLIAEFAERDCRFSATKGTSLSWDNIRDGVNLTVEIAKVLLLLVYHDIMNDRCTLNMLECDVEREIANLTGCFVMESEGCVYLGNGLDAYLARKYLPIDCEVLERSAATSSSNMSTISSLSDDDSPVFHRRQKVTFVDIQTVASSSVSKSPLQDIMNTPKFQLRKMQRQMIKERDYRDGLERELATKVALIAQNETHINQLQYRLDKLKEEQDDREQVIREQINDLETRNDKLQMRFNEMLKQNKDFKSTSSLMERKVDELTDENGVLSSQMRAAYSQLAIFEAEVDRLKESQTFTQDEWSRKTNHLESELNQATAQKELLKEQIQILQGKISCLEDEISRASKEEVGENMGPIMEREMFETEINSLKSDLEIACSSLKNAEVEIQAKTQQLAEYQEEITQQKDLWRQEKLQTTELIQAKEETLETLQKEITEQRAALQQEIQALKLELEQVEQQKIEEMSRLQHHIAGCEQEMEKLKNIKKEKEGLLHLAEENIKDLEEKLSAVSSLLADKDQQISSLRGEVEILHDETKSHKNEIQSKEERLANLLLEKSNEQEMFNIKIQTLTVQVEDLRSSLRQAEQEIQHKQDLLAQTQQENIQQREAFQQQIVACEEEVQTLNKEMQEKNEQLVVLKDDSSRQSESLEQNIKDLKAQLESLNGSLRKAEEQVQAQEVMLTKQEQESAHQIKLLQQQLSASEQRIRSVKEEIQTKEEQMNMLENRSSEQTEILNREIHDLKKLVECLSSSLRNAEENLQSKENLLAEQRLQSTRDMEALQTQMVTSQDEVKRLNAEIHKNVEQYVLLKAKTSTHSELLQQEIESLNKQLQSISDSFQMTKDDIQAKENLMVKQEQEKELLQQQLSTSEEEVRKMKEEIQAKEEQIMMLKTDNSAQLDLLHQEIQILKNQVECLRTSLKNAEKNLQSKETLFAEQHLQTTQEMEALQTQMAASENEVKRLNEEIHMKEGQLILLKTETSARSESLEQEIESLTKQIKIMSSSLDTANDQVQAKDILMANQEQESTLQIEELRKHNSVLEEALSRLREDLKIKEGEANMLKDESCKESEMMHNEIHTLRDQVQSLEDSLKTTAEQVQSKESLLVQKEIEISQEKDQFKVLMTTSEGEMRALRGQIQAKDEQLVTLKEESSKHSDMLQQDIQCLNNQLAHITDCLSKSEEKVQAQLVLLNKQEQESAQQEELLQQQVSASEEQVSKMKDEIRAQEERMTLLRTESSAQSDLLHQEIQHLQTQVESLGSSLKKAQEDMQSKENLLAQQELENIQQREALVSQQEKVKEVEILQKQIYSLEDETQKLKASESEKDHLLLKAEEKLQILQTEFSVVNALVADKDRSLNSLRDEVAAQANEAQKAIEDALAKEKMLAETKEEESKQMAALQHEIRDLKMEIETVSQKFLAKEQVLLQIQQESATQMDVLRQQLASVNAERQSAQEVNVATSKEMEALVQEKEALMTAMLQVEKDKKALERQHEVVVLEKDRLAQAKQAIERENLASHKLESVLQQELEIMKTERLLKEREKVEEIEVVKRDLQEQLSAKSEAAEHYKAQMDKAVSHYNSKKQLLQESQEEVAELKHSLEVKAREVKAVAMENKMLQLDLDKAKTNEKKLVTTVASLEAQLALADRNLRAQNKIHGNERSATESCYLDVPAVRTRAQMKRTMSSDSLDQSSLEDSLNTTRKLSAPDESSTPLVRSSERLAAKRRGLHAESLETLYFTPINNRTAKDHKMELSSTLKNPTSSVKRRRTTQVINITMTKKTPCGGDGDETFYSLAPACSQPNLSNAHYARPVSMELFDTPARKSGTTSDQLIGLPGYRRSAVHSQPTSTFCVGTENEPEAAPDDWMRIAELQARNKACLPHLKSSYPVESDPCRGNAFFFTDEELRTGEPSDTIRRASMMPGQLQDSLPSHRLSLMVGQSAAAASARSRRLSLMPGQLPSRTVSSSQLRSPKGTKRSSSTLSVPPTSAEKKVKASCFPRPLTPKNKNVISGSSSSQLSPADRRQSMMFSIDNTPKNSNYLKKGLNKLRNSTRKSPGKSTKKSSAQTPALKSQENIPSRNPPAGVVRASRIGSSKSPLATNGQKNSPRVTGRPAKSPGLTASARKMMRRVKV